MAIWGAPLSKRHAGVSVLGCAIAMVAVGGCAQVGPVEKGTTGRSRVAELETVGFFSTSCTQRAKSNFCLQVFNFSFWVVGVVGSNTPFVAKWQGIGQLFAALVVGMARNPSMKEDLFTCAGTHFRSDQWTTGRWFFEDFFLNSRMTAVCRCTVWSIVFFFQLWTVFFVFIHRLILKARR